MAIDSVRRMGTVASEVERRQDRVAKPSGDDAVQAACARIVCVSWTMCIWDAPPQGCGCRLALPRVSIQPGVAYGDLHFPGCPFSPGLLTEEKTTRAITAVVVVEHAYCESALAVVGYFTSGFDTVCCEP